MRSPVRLYAGGSEQLEFSATSPSLPTALSSSLVPRSLSPVPPRGRIEGMRGIPTLGSVPASSFLRVVPRRSREQEHASRCAVRWCRKCQGTEKSPGQMGITAIDSQLWMVGTSPPRTL